MTPLSPQPRATEADARGTMVPINFVLEAARIGTWEWEIDTNEVRWSANMEELHGLAPGAFDGRFESYLELVHPDDRAKLTETINHVLETGEHYHIEYREGRDRGEVRWIEAKGQVVRDDAGQPVRMVGICMDVTPRKLAELNTARLASIVRSSNDAIIGKTLDGIIESFNPGAERMYGYRAEEVIGKPISILVPEDRADEFPAIMKRLRRGERIENYETVRRRKDGSLIEVSVTVSPTRRGDGTIIGASAIARDITERKRAEQKLRDSENRYRTLFERIDEGFGILEVIFDDEGEPKDLRWIQANPAWTTQIGIDNQNLVGRRVREVLPDVNESWYQLYGRIVRTGKPVRVEEYDPALGRWLEVYAFRYGDASDRQVGVLFKDTTKRKQTEQALLESEQRLTIAKTAAKLGIHDYDIATGRIEWDDRTRAIWSVDTDQQITYEFWRNSLHPDDLESTEAKVKQSLDPAGDGKFAAEYRIVNRQGGPPRWVRATGQMIFDRDEPVRLIGTVEDITERKRAEQELARNEANLRDFFDNAAVGLHWVGPDGIILRANRAELEMLGYEEDEYVGRHIAEFHVDQHEIEDILQRLSSGETLRDREARLRCKDGSIRHVLIDSNVNWENGRFLHTRCFTRDITARKQAERDLAFQKRALDQSSIVAITDVRGTITYVNDKFCEISGYSREELLGQNHRILNSGLHPRKFFREMYRTISRSETWHGEIRNRRKDGSFYWVDTTIVPAMGPEGRPEQYVAIRNDITDRIEAERKLRELNHTLELRVFNRTSQLRALTRQLTRAEQDERRRLARILHDDLQQLLVAASMRTERLAQRVAEADTAALAQQVQDLIKQSIDSSRLLTQELSPPVLYERGICATLPWLAETMQRRYGLSVSVDIDERAELHNEETRVSLYLAARELLFNVVKHAEVEHATLSLTRTAPGLVRLAVEDEGCGFDVTGIEDGQTRTGLGLFGLRERAGFFDGRMTIRSSPGEGARIEIEVPDRAPAARDEAGSAVASHDAGVAAPVRSRDRSTTRVLIADDHQIFREGIVGILAEHHDIEVVAEVGDGQQAIEQVLKHQPDVVIMDTTMPALNGIDATRQITRRLPHIVVIGLSMHDSTKMAKAMREAGATRVLVKDGPAGALIEAIRAAVSEGRR